MITGPGLELFKVKLRLLGNFPTRGAQGSVEASARALGADIDVRLGSEDSNVSSSVIAEAGVVEVGVNGSLSMQGGSIGAKAGVYPGRASGSVSVTAFGITIGVSGEANGADVGAHGKFLLFNSVFKFNGGFAAIVGSLVAGLSISWQ